jgi:tetratricopeptide (TPR) repeat protein
MGRPVRRKTVVIPALAAFLIAATAVPSAAEKCLKYLPTTGTSIEVPCEATEDAQTAGEACDRLAASPFDPNRVTQGVPFADIQQSAAVAACRKAVERNPATPRFKYQLARALDRSGAYAEALPLYQPLAEAGYLTALNALGQMYENGKGVTKDDAKAVGYYKRAADKGFAIAITNLGLMTAQGRGVAKNEAEAVRLFKQSAEKGEAIAMYALGVMYTGGNGVAKDEAEALRLYKQAAEKGNSNAMYGVGNAYAFGRGVPVDEKEAARWIFAALEKGDSFATKEMTTNAMEWTIRFRAELQKRLRDAGVYSGRAEGDVGPDFSEAIAALAARAKQ